MIKLNDIIRHAAKQYAFEYDIYSLYAASRTGFSSISANIKLQSCKYLWFFPEL